jgi:formyl-CoA transferase
VAGGSVTGARHGPDDQNLHRNKRGVCIDLKHPDGAALFRRLVERADIVVENFRADVKTRLGIDYAQLRQINPRIILASISGFGQDGPYADRAGVDQIVQGMSGLMSITGEPGGPPMRVGIAISDTTAGMFLGQGILLALLHRERTGEGQKVSVSLYNSMLAAQMQEAAMIMNADSEINWAAMPLTGVFETQDGAVVVVGAFKANPLRDICAALDIPDLSTDPRFATLAAQFEHKPLLHEMFRARYRTQTTDYWLARLEAQDLLCAPVRTLREALADPQTAHNGMIIEAADADAATRLVGSPIRMSAAPVGVRRLPPLLGEHTDEILAEAQGLTLMPLAE